MPFKVHKLNNEHYIKVDEVLSMECDKDLEEGKNPGPMVEIEFWEAKSRNLESLFEQVDQCIATYMKLLTTLDEK